MIHVKDVAYVRLQAPDLALMETFLLDFGLCKLQGDARTLYMRSYGTQPCVHITEHGAQAKLLGFGLVAQSAADLHTLAAAFNTNVVANPEPGGGQRVTVRDPQGLSVEVVFGQQPAPALPVRAPITPNPAAPRQRLGDVARIPRGPSHAMRLGHLVLKVPDLPASMDFYQKNFGFKVADGYYGESPEHLIGMFMRCGLGRQFTDHHTLALIAHPEGGLEHMAFEVLDWDDLQIGNQYLLGKRYRHSWGIGRHIEGSQIFDYWRDPFDNKIEHWTDGDLINDDYASGITQFGPHSLSQWSPPMGDDFMR